MLAGTSLERQSLIIIPLHNAANDSDNGFDHISVP